MTSEDMPGEIEQVLETPDLAAALQSDWFKQFLDQLPVAISISQLDPAETVVFANAEFERLTGMPNASIVGGGWERVIGRGDAHDDIRSLAQAVVGAHDLVGVFALMRDGQRVTVDVWSHVIQNNAGEPAFRLVALVESTASDTSILDELQQRVLEKDTQLRELQHRVKNNLQMITALIRIEARGVSDRSTGEGFDRLAGRVEALGLLYHALAGQQDTDAVDLGIYLSEIASAVMRAHAVEGIRLDLKVDTWPVAIDVAMPAGLVVNELLTNALKHAFVGRDGGTITLHSITQPNGGRPPSFAPVSLSRPGLSNPLYTLCTAADVFQVQV